MNNPAYIPEEHFVRPSEKLKPDWALKMAKHYYFGGQMRSLLEGKDLLAIQQYAEGKQPMVEFEKMFAGNNKSTVAVTMKNEDGTVMTDENGTPEIIEMLQEDLSGIDWEPLDILSQPLNSAISLIHKQPIEVKATALDPLAVTKKNQDRDWIRNKSKNAALLQPLAEKLGVDEFPLGDPGGASDGVPMGLDLSNDEEQELYFDMFYKFRPESAFETMLTQLGLVQNFRAYQEQEIRDHFYYGASAHQLHISQTTGLPELKSYFHPSKVFVPSYCIDKQYEDSDVRYIEAKMTVAQMYDAFGEEIPDEETMKKILTAWSTANSSINVGPLTKNNEIDWGFTLNMVYWEIKSMDILTFREFYQKGKKVMKYAEDGKTPRFAQNTYTFYWLPGTDFVFRLERLKGFERKKGQEYKSPFSIRVYKSQERSAVESCIGHVKMAQKAYIKLQHAIIRAKPSGQYVDLRFLRNAFETLSESGSPFTLKRLLSLLFVNNIYIGDTEGMGPEAYNAKPVSDIPGGIKDIEGYLNTFNIAVQNIARITGINEQLTGQSPNPSGLVGLQKLLINSAVNSLHYVTEAITEQYKGLYRQVGWQCLQILKAGGAPADAIKAMIGERKVEILTSIDEMTAHQFGVDINIGQAEEIRQSVQQKLEFMVQNKLIPPGDALLVERVNAVNPKDAIAYLVIKEKKEIRRQQQDAEANRRAMIESQKTKSEGDMQVKNIEIQGELAKIQAQAEADAKLKQLAHALNLDAEYLRGQQKRSLQDARGTDQLLKLLAGIERKSDVKAREV